MICKLYKEFETQTYTSRTTARPSDDSSIPTTLNSLVILSTTQSKQKHKHTEKTTTNVGIKTNTNE